MKVACDAGLSAHILSAVSRSSPSSAPIAPESGRPVVAEAALVVMARSAAEAEVKTRLALAVGPSRARAQYRHLLRDTLAALEEAATSIAANDLVPNAQSTADPAPALVVALAGEQVAMTFPAGWEVLEQRGDGLGERLAMVFADLFARGHTAVVVVGSDSPGLPPAYVVQSVDLLRRGAAAVGPAADGGFYLLGLSRSAWTHHAPRLRALLKTVPMGTSLARDHLVAGLRELDLAVDLLPLWVDVDVAADLPLARRLIGGGAGRGGSRPQLGSVYLHVTHRCTGVCLHCYDRDSDKHDELSQDAWLDVVSQAVAMGATRFEIIGGDPFVRADLLDLIRAITGVHGARVRLFFNRALDEAGAAALAAAGHGLLTPLLSLDGDEDVNDSLRGRGNFSAASATARRLAQAGLRPVVNTVLLRPTLEGLHRLPDVLRGMRVTQLHLILPHARGGLSGRPEMVPSGAELLEAFERLLPAASAAGVVVDNLDAWKSRLGPPRDLCNAGCSLLTVGPTGLVYACPITCGDPAFAAGDARTTPLARIWRESAALALVRHSSARDRVACAACDVVEACGGDCWVQAHYAARVASQPAGLAAPFPYCGLLQPVFADLLAAEHCGRETSGGSSADAMPTQTPPLTPFECI